MIEAALGTAFALLTVRRMRISNWARNRAVLPLLVALIAAVYLGFGLAAHDSGVFWKEAQWAGVFFALAAGAYFGPAWLAGMVLIAHGGFDLGHAFLFENPAVPQWYPLFCASYDCVLAGLILWRKAKS